MTEAFDPTKPTQSRSGREVLIYTTEHPHPHYPIVGAIKLPRGWTLNRWTKDGHNYAYAGTHPSDLVNDEEGDYYEGWEEGYKQGLMKTAGIDEVAVRNPSVMDYMEQWEGRAEKAEAENERLREYANHKRSCEMMDAFIQGKTCTCGYQAALKGDTQ